MWLSTTYTSHTLKNPDVPYFNIQQLKIYDKQLQTNRASAVTDSQLSVA